MSTTTNPTPSWETIAAEYRAQAASKIPAAWLLAPSITSSLSETSTANVLDVPRTCGILSSSEIEITERYNAVALLSLLASGKISSVDVTTAFCKRAAIAGQLTNCLTEIFFEQALQRAKYCDEYLAKERKTIGPFHGLPVSLKDSFNLRGIKSTIGFTSFVANPPSNVDSPLVQILLSKGAVLYVKTNIPQTLMTADSHNYIFGRTLNPHNLSVTAGGSSGGEGALSALRGSVLGVGTDIAGSIRIPAHCNGVIGFKPSTRRIPYSGQTAPGRPGTFGISACAGPICRSMADAEYFMKHVLDFDVWSLDEQVLSLPWRSVDFEGKRLRLGVLTEHEMWPLHPPMSRAFSTVSKKLTRAGHTLIPLEPHIPSSLLSDTVVTAMKLFSSDPQKTSFARIAASGEPMIPSIPSTAPPEILTYKASLDGVFDLHAAMRDIQKVIREMWIKLELDGLIMPVFQGTAVEHDAYGAPPYTVLANLLDYPSCALPVGKADIKLDTPFIRDVKYVPTYNPDIIEGAPGGIQILGRPLKDEETVAMAKIVMDILSAA